VCDPAASDISAAEINWSRAGLIRQESWLTVNANFGGLLTPLAGCYESNIAFAKQA
jgi:hypothetical protein